MASWGVTRCKAEPISWMSVDCVRGSAQVSFDFASHYFDRVEFWTLSRKEEDFASISMVAAVRERGVKPL